MPAVIGTLRADLTAGIAEFTAGFNRAADQVKKFGETTRKIGGDLSGFGRDMSLYVTAPLVAMAAGIVKVSGDFEAGMTRVDIAAQATAGELKALERQARDIGKTTTFSASEAAGAMEELAKAGVGTKDILNGAARAAVDLAAATGSGIAPAATAASDVMNQFKIRAQDLGAAVNQITGAVNESKLGFEDYQQAIAQSGGVAASLGVTFKDFNAALAGTSTLFQSGSDAGTSFKTFITSLVPKSNEAREAMSRLGLQFFDAAGALKPMAAIAQNLKDKLSGLSEEARNEALRTIFGSDAMRTAIGLMDLGAAGLDKIAAKIAATDAAAQSAKRMEGFNGQLEQLKGSAEELAIAIGQSGLLGFVTKLVTGLANFVDKISALPAPVLAAGVAFAAVVAGIGPVIVGLGAVVSAVGTLAPLVSGLVAGLGAMAGGAGLAGIAVAAAPVAAGIAAVVAAFMLLKDDVGPVLADLWSRAQNTLGPPMVALFQAAKSAFAAFGAAFKSLGESAFVQTIGKMAAAFTGFFGVTLLKIMGVVVAGLTGAFNIIAGLLRFITAILNGDWKGAWTAAVDILRAAGSTFVNIVKAVAPAVVNAIANMVLGVQKWLHEKLPALFKAPQQATKDTSVAFVAMKKDVTEVTMPAMVAGVKAQADKLPQALGGGAEAAATRATTAFRKLKDDLAALTSELATDAENNMRKLDERLALIQRGRKSGDLSAAEAADLEGRAMYDAAKTANGTPAELVPMKVKVEPIVSDDALAKANDALARQAEALKANMTAAWTTVKDIGMGAIQEWVNTGEFNWKRLGNDLIRNWDSTMKVLSDIWKKVSGMMNGGGFGGGSGGGLMGLAKTAMSLFGGFRAKGGPVQRGKVYMTGEKGPEPFIPGTSGTILPNDFLRGGDRAPGGNTVVINANDAVLAETVKGWVTQGMRVAEFRATAGAVQIARDIVPQEMARDASNSFV